MTPRQNHLRPLCSIVVANSIPTGGCSFRDRRPDPGCAGQIQSSADARGHGIRARVVGEAEVEGVRRRWDQAVSPELGAGVAAGVSLHGDVLDPCTEDGVERSTEPVTEDPELHREEDIGPAHYGKRSALVDYT